MYGDDDDYQNEARPPSFIAAPRGSDRFSEDIDLDMSAAEEHGLRLVLSAPSETGPPSGLAPIQTLPVPIQGQRRLSSSGLPSGATSPVASNGPMSPTLRDMRAGSDSYPLTNIDNPNDIAQELSNLQALRRLSMDVSNNSDPDLLPFQGMSLMAMPSIAPKGDDDADPSRLLWVPAGVHPELAPSEFKSFVEKRVQSMKRRSGENSLSPDSILRSESGGLRRKKSMLSRQVENNGGHAANNYIDGAGRLERRTSLGQSGRASTELSIDELMNDPSNAVRKLTLESQGGSDNTSNTDDMPILPMAPGTGLRRSTRTTYRKGGSLKNRQGSISHNERLPFAQRMAAKRGAVGDDSPPSPESHIDAPPGHHLVRVQSEPVLDNRTVRRQPSQKDSIDVPEYGVQSTAHEQDKSQPIRPSASTRIHSPEDTRSFTPAPQTHENPPIIDEEAEEEEESPRHRESNRPFPERSSSQHAPVHNYTRQPSGPSSDPVHRSNQRPTPGQPYQSPSQHQAANPSAQPRRSAGAPSEDTAHLPSSMAPGSASRTDTLTFIPTFSPEEKKSEKRSKKDSTDSGSSKGSSWKWFKSEDKEKKKKEEEHRKSKARASAEKAHDNVRLDVLQTSIDTASHKGRESLLLDRDNIDNKLEEERRKESTRKTGEQKKEKDSLFSSIFGSSKKKDRDSGSRKSHSQRPLSPEPAPYRPLRPDTDYPWTRFPILEERAIYRMAHIKLANPRRALHSQVLLSNFMYAYLAKVQALNPQIQVPQSPQQRRLQEEERKRREQEQQYLEQQYLEQQQAQESMDRYNYEYHRSANQYSDPSMQHESGNYAEGAEGYDYDQSKDNRGLEGGYGDGYGGAKDHYPYNSQNGQQHHDKEEDMW
ncbi:hypothetical protein GGR50DRAFT_694807 [Xylaria sp. CBS 124048]|nr:hypothetical protein GGR50DRAFT_694807 [Xylaria sp. CBS 124048]